MATKKKAPTAKKRGVTPKQQRERRDDYFARQAARDAREDARDDRREAREEKLFATFAKIGSAVAEQFTDETEARRERRADEKARREKLEKFAEGLGTKVGLGEVFCPPLGFGLTPGVLHQVEQRVRELIREEVTEHLKRERVKQEHPDVIDADYEKTGDAPSDEGGSPLDPT